VVKKENTLSVPLTKAALWKFLVYMHDGSTRIAWVKHKYWIAARELALRAPGALRAECVLSPHDENYEAKLSLGLRFSESGRRASLIQAPSMAKKNGVAALAAAEAIGKFFLKPEPSKKLSKRAKKKR
jgi:hypothetical protein